MHDTRRTLLDCTSAQTHIFIFTHQLHAETTALVPNLLFAPGLCAQFPPGHTHRDAHSVGVMSNEMLACAARARRRGSGYMSGEGAGS